MNNSFLSVKSVFENCLKSNSIAFVGAALISLALTGCGGGGGSKSAASAPLTAFTGTAAVGTAISGAPVSGLCVAGTPAPATTDPNGKYTLQLAGLTLPCILSVPVPPANLTTADPVYGTTTTLYSAVYAGQAVANITPITNLIVTNALGVDPSTITTSGNVGTYAAKLSSASIASAYKIINTALTAAQITVPSNPLTSQFTAATASTEGDASDKSIDLFMNAIRQVQITTGTTVTTLTSVTTGLKNTTTSADATSYITNTAGLTSNPSPGKMTIAVSLVSNGYDMATIPLVFASRVSTTQIDYNASIGTGDLITLLGNFNTNNNDCLTDISNTNTCPFNLTGLGITGNITRILQDTHDGHLVMDIQSLNINVATVLSFIDQPSGFYKIWKLILESNGGVEVTNNGAKLICPTPADPLTPVGTIAVPSSTSNAPSFNIEQSFITNCKP